MKRLTFILVIALFCLSVLVVALALALTRCPCDKPNALELLWTAQAPTLNAFNTQKAPPSELTVTARAANLSATLTAFPTPTPQG